VSVMVDERLAVVLVPPTLPGVSRRPFWRNPALMGAQSCEVILENVVVPERLVSYSGNQHELDAAQVGAFVWFETLIAASYIGAASALAELALQKPGPMSPQLTAAVGAIEASMAAVERVVAELEHPARDDALLARALLVRYGVQDAIFTAAASAAEILGGVSFATLPDISLLLAACRALTYHPPSRMRMAEPLGEWLGGAALRIP